MPPQTARARAIATQDEAIANNVAKIEEAKARPSAIESMASRLNVSTGVLTSTLKNTVFRGASNEEFVALVVVANAYKLNPLLKEIFAFPAKGGGIIPVVSVDGWIRIINEHPQFDGIDFNDIVDDDGTLYAIESVIYRRDRSRPIKVTEYMDECKGAGPAWQKTPKRMLRHRALIQGGRVAFGFSGIYVEDEAGTVIGTVQQDGGEDARPVAPTRQQITHDPQTGEILDEATARALDSEGFAAMEGRTDEQHGDQHDGTDDPRAAIITDMLDRCTRASVIGDLHSIMADWETHALALPDEFGDECAKVEAAIAALKKRLGAK